MRIMFGKNFQTDMFLRNALYSASHNTKIIDVFGIGQNGHSESTRLCTFGLMGRIEQFGDGWVCQKTAVHLGCNSQSMRFKRRNGSLDDGDDVWSETAI